ncbi:MULTISPECIES: hypothetical protein [Chryseobacterium]|jgi:hypothetical protein|uniref:hypothetical protein n=1 Tax=Chryseobacterium TaxID=59732 RepID=UPI000EB17D51|nr:hypothetical protein [Chryseobacterium sp. 7]RLJ34194.1 hypothetical protein CLU97_3689 [Chryseobacterium sp. 7]
MDKDKKTKQYNGYNKDIIRRLKQKHGFTARFIYASLRGNRTSDSSTKIVDDYNKMKKAIQQVLNNI